VISNIQSTKEKQLMHDIHLSTNNTSIIEGRDDNECDYAFSSSEQHNIEIDTQDNIENQPHIIDTTQHQSSTTFLIKLPKKSKSMNKHSITTQMKSTLENPSVLKKHHHLQHISC
jgi:hypothetical protein